MRIDYITYLWNESPLRTSNLEQSILVSFWSTLIELSDRAYGLDLAGDGYLHPNHNTTPVGKRLQEVFVLSQRPVYREVLVYGRNELNWITQAIE